MKIVQVLMKTIAVVGVCSAVALCQQFGAAGGGYHVGRILDWTQHHIAYSGGLTQADLRAAENEPRILFQMAERYRIEHGRPDPRRPRHSVAVDGINQKNGATIDWAVNLGNGAVAPNMFPAKYSFDINATPSCANDYVVFALNVAGATNGQANIVGINQLYSGTGTSLCGRTTPLVEFAFNGSTAAGTVITSPSPSLDGTKIAYVESVGGTSTSGSSIFHVLTWKAGGTVTKAIAPSRPGVGTGCTAATSCLTSVTYSASFNTHYASPWIDYATDKAFVASDDGTISRISCVFTCALNTNPTIDWSFKLPVAGTGGALPMPGGGVYNYPYKKLFITDQLGEVWAINDLGTSAVLAAGPVMIGGGGCTSTNPPGRTGTPNPCTANGSSYGIPDPVILDASGNAERIFAFSGNDGGQGPVATGGTQAQSAVVAQIDQNLTNIVKAYVGLGSAGNNANNVDLHTGAFNDNYWGATPASNGLLFVCGTSATDTSPFHYWLSFANYPVMDATPKGSLPRFPAPGTGHAGVPCTPYTELYNPTLNLGGNGSHDMLVSGITNATNGYIIVDSLDSGTVIGVVSQNYPGGVSGIVIDNVSGSAQASSVYFGTLTKTTAGTCANQNCAVKLTQSSLQ